MYWSGANLNSLTTCSNSVMVGTTGPMGSGFPQFGLPRRFAMKLQPAFWIDRVRDRCRSLATNRRNVARPLSAATYIEQPYCQRTMDHLGVSTSCRRNRWCQTDLV